MADSVKSSLLPVVESYWTIQTDVTAAVSKASDATFGSDNSAVTGSDVIVNTPGCILYSFVVSTVLIGCLCIFGVAGNTAAFIVFQRDKLKTSTSFLFQGIAVVDNLLLVTAFPIYCIEPFVEYTGLCEGYYQYARAIVLVHIFPLAFIAQTATVWSTVLIGVNRYIAVCHPYQAARLCSVRQARLQLTFVLLFAVIYNMPKLAESRVEFDNELDVGPVDGASVNEYLTTATTGDYNAPTISEPLPVGLIPAYTWLGTNKIYLRIYGNVMYTIFMLALPLLTLTVLNVRLIRALKALGRKRAELQRRGGRPNCSRRQQAQDNNVTLVLIIVLLVFTICQAPALVTQFLWNVLPDSERLCGGVQFYYSRLTNLLVIANSSVNFIVYLAFNTRFRQILQQMSICGGVVSGPQSTEVISCTVVAGGLDSGGGGKSGAAGCAIVGSNHPTVIEFNLIAANTAAGDDVIIGEGHIALESMSLLPNNSKTTHYGQTTHDAAEDMHVTVTNTGHDELSEMQQVAPLRKTTDDCDDVMNSKGRGGMHVVLVDYSDDV